MCGKNRNSNNDNDDDNSGSSQANNTCSRKKQYLRRVNDLTTLHKDHLHLVHHLAVLRFLQHEVLCRDCLVNVSGS